MSEVTVTIIFESVSESLCKRANVIVLSTLREFLTNNIVYLNAVLCKHKNPKHVCRLQGAREFSLYLALILHVMCACTYVLQRAFPGFK